MISLSDGNTPSQSPAKEELVHVRQMTKPQLCFCFTVPNCQRIGQNFIHPSEEERAAPLEQLACFTWPKILTGRKTKARRASCPLPSKPQALPTAQRWRSEGDLGAGSTVVAPLQRGGTSWALREPQQKHQTFYNIIACFIDIHSKAVYSTIVRHIFGEIWYVVKNAVKQKFIKIISKCYSVGVKTQYIMISK